MKLVTYTANATWKFLSYKKWQNFQQATLNVEKFQRDYLLKLLRRNASTIYGQKYGFGQINSVDEYQRRVPVTEYEDYLPYVEEIKKGKSHVLTTEPVPLLEPTSGTASATKLIPYTKSLKQEFQGGIGPWIYNLFKTYPDLLHGKAYWAITPNTPNFHQVGSKVPIGFDADTEYFGVLEKFLVNKTTIVPSELSKINCLESFRYITLLFLLSESNLRMISVWNPTYLELLLQNVKNFFERLIKDIRNGEINPPTSIPQSFVEKLKIKKKPERAEELQNIFAANKNGRLQFSWDRIWPQLELISCWTEGWAEKFVPQVKALFPNVTIQSKGLLATEAFVTFPLENIGHVLSVTSHFFEFEDCDTQQIKLAEELELGKKYSVIVTTGGGLYRYRLNDLLRVEGAYRKAPLLKFIGKTEGVLDLFGEKLHEEFVSEILLEVFRKFSITTDFYFVAPQSSSGMYCYTLFISNHGNSFDNVLLSEEIDRRLCKNFHYKYCRDLGQLGEFKVYQLSESARKIYLTHKSKESRLGTAKYSLLERQTDWLELFENKHPELHG